MSSQVKGAPIGFSHCILPTHIQRFPLSSPISPRKSWQPSQRLKHKRNVSTLILSLSAGRCRKLGLAKKRRVPLLKGPQSSSFLHMVDDQTSEEDSSQVLRRQWLFPAKHCRVTSGMQPDIFSHQLHDLDNRLCPVLDVQSWDS